MTQWIRSYNIKDDYDIITAFNESEIVAVPKYYYDIKANEIVYIYVCSPIKQILFKTYCVCDNVDSLSCQDDLKYYKCNQVGVSFPCVKLKLLQKNLTNQLTLDDFISKGLIGNIPGSVRLERHKKLLNYIETILYVKVDDMDKEADASSVVGGTVLAAPEIARASEIYARMTEGLEALDTARGGAKGFHGFVAEEMQAAGASVKGKATYVINNNGDADLVFVGNNGHRYYQQMKVGYETGSINFEQYKGQTLILDKGNPRFHEFQTEGAKYGVKVVEGNVTKEEAQELAQYMQKETAFTGAKNAQFVPKVKAAHEAGLSGAKSGALYGAGFSIGSNIVDVACGDKALGEAAKDVVVDTAVCGAVGYGVGAVGSVVAGTTTGAAVISAAGAAGTAIAGTTVGGAVVAGTTVASAAVAGAGVAATTAVVGAVGTVGSAIGGAAVAATAGTAIGGAVATGVAATAAAGAAVGAAAVAAAPVVAVGAAIGITFSLIKKLF